MTGSSARQRAAKAEKEREEPPSSGSGRRSRRKSGGIPWWVYGIGGFALLACAGQLLANGSTSSTSRAKADKGSEKGSTAAYLDIARRLSEMTGIASTLSTAGELDGKVTKELDEELIQIEGEIDGLGDSIARDLRSMVSVVRGTLYQKSHSLSDDQVEKMKNSYTYANPRYWDEYYKSLEKEERFDWYGSWDGPLTKKHVFVTQKALGGEEVEANKVGDLLRPYLTHVRGDRADGPRVLMLGCGNSDMSEKMYMDGFENVVNIDVSEKLLENMRQKLQDRMPKMRWQYMNASELTFDDGEFDAIIDKGTFDAIEANVPLTGAAMAEARRVLRPGGFLLSVTFNAPVIRLDKQLSQYAKWAGCASHAFERPSNTGTTKKFYVHACERGE